MKLLLLLRIEIVRTFWELRRYPFQTLTGLLGLGLFFYLFFGAGQVVSGGTQTSANTASLILMYVTGFLALMEFSMPSSSIARESKSGTLEFLYLSKFSLLSIFGMRSLGTLVVALPQMLLLTFALLFATNATIIWSLEMILPLVCMLVSAFGLGLILAALALLFKDTSGLQGLVQLPLVALCGLPLINAFWFYLLPFASSASFIRVIAFGGHMSPESALLCVLNALAYLGLGYLVLNFGLRVAKQKGLLGHE